MEIKSDDAKPLVVMAVSPECHAGFARLFSGDTVKVIPITDVIQGAEADVFVTDDPQELASIADHYSKQFEGWVVRKMHCGDTNLIVTARHDNHANKVLYDCHSVEGDINRGPSFNKKKGRRGRQFRG